MLSKPSAAFTYALFPRYAVGVKVVVNDFRVKKCSDFMDVLCGEAVIEDSHIFDSVCCFPHSLNKVMTDNKSMQKNIAIKRMRFDPTDDDMKRKILSVPVVFL
jgi:hypothetical protein